MSEQNVIEIVFGPTPEAEEAEETKAEGAVSANFTPGGGVTACICPECGHEEPHEAGEPCSAEKCPECGATMTGKVAEKGTTSGSSRPGGGVTACVCPECGHEEPHEAGEPCSAEKCPKCGAAMIGKVAEKEAKPAQIVKNILDQAKTRILSLFGKNGADAEIAPEAPESAIVRGFKVFEGADGHDWLLTWTTNAFEDREGEIFSTKSIQDFIDRHEGDEIKGDYWFWHLPGTKFGTIRWQGLVGRFLVEAGPFDNTPVGEAFKSFFMRFPDGHPDVAPLGWGTSHGYVYRLPDRMDGIYEWFDKKETTILPSHAAANAYTAMEVLEMALSQKQKDALAAIGGNDLVTLVEAKGNQMTKELEAAGIAYKGDDGADEETPKVIPEGGFAGQIGQIAGQVEDDEVADALKGIAQELWEGDKADADEDDEEDEEESEEEEPEAPPQKPAPKKESEEEEEEEEEDKKAQWTTAYKNSLPDSAFLFVQSGGEKDGEGKTEPRSYRHLPYRDKAGAVDAPHLRNAVSRLGQSDTGETEAGDWLTEDVRQRLLAKARALLEKGSKGLSNLGILAERLGGIADQVGGQKGTYLGAIATAMEQVSEAGKSLESGGDETEPPEAPEKPEAPDVKAIAQTVVEALQLDALSETLTGMRQQIDTLTAEVKSLNEDKAALTARLEETEKVDEQRLAEKELGLPRYSWFRSSQAAETVANDHTAAATKAVRRGPNALNALAASMAGKE